MEVSLIPPSSPLAASPNRATGFGAARTGNLQLERRGEGGGVRFVYKPFGIVFGVLGGMIAGAILRRIWSRVAHEPDTPDATDADRGWREVVAAAALEGAVFGGVRALVDRAGATGFARVTGVWPGQTSRT